MSGLPTCKGEQYTFFPYWTQTFGEFKIGAWSEHSRREDLRDFSLFGVEPLSNENRRFLEGGALFEHTFDENPEYIEYMGEDDDPT